MLNLTQYVKIFEGGSYKMKINYMNYFYNFLIKMILKDNIKK